MDYFIYELNTVYNKKELEWLEIAYSAISEYSAGFEPNIIHLLITETGERKIKSLLLVKNKLIELKKNIVIAYKKYWKRRVKLYKLDDAIRGYNDIFSKV